MSKVQSSKFKIPRH